MIHFSLTSPHGDNPIPSLITSISMFVLLVFVLTRRNKTKLIYAFSAYNACIAVWIFGIYQLTVAATATEGLFWAKFLNADAYLIPPTFFHFVMLFIDPTAPLKHK